MLVAASGAILGKGSKLLLGECSKAAPHGFVCSPDLAGLENLTEDELRMACRARGMRAPYGLGAEAFMQRQMRVGCRCYIAKLAEGQTHVSMKLEVAQLASVTCHSPGWLRRTGNFLKASDGKCAAKTIH